MNQLFQQLQNQRMQSQQNLNLQPQSNQKLSMLKNNFQNIQSLLKSSSPQEVIQTLTKNNPQMQNVLQLFQNSQMTPKQFFYQYAQQMGIDPDQFINMIK